MVKKTFRSYPPASKKLTKYDEENLKTYLCLLDAEREKADWQEVVSIVFGVDSDKNLESAKKMYDSHLERARWISESGFVQLLNKDGTDSKK